MKALRAILSILVAGGLAYLLFRGIRGNPPAPPPVVPVVPADVPADGGPGANPFAPFGDPTDPKAAENPATTAPPPATNNVDATLVGTPTTSASEVSLVVPYKKGVKCRYRVHDAELRKNRDTDEAWWGQWIWTVSTEVIQGDGSGAARIRFQIDSFRYQTEAPGRRIDVDSENPDRKLIDDPQFGLARGIKPFLAIRGMPVEFVIDAGGVVRAVDGVKEMNRKFLDVVSTFGAQEEQNADDAPTAENLIERWGECLFPALGGGKLKGDATRDASFRTTYADRWCSVASGRLRATHDDADAFRVEFKGAPKMEELLRPAVRPKFQNVEKAQVVTSADAYVLAWRFDRANGRLLAARKRANYRLDISSRAGVVAGVQQFDPSHTNIDRQIDVELLDR